MTYGCEIVLSDTLSSITTSSLFIRKVDKGKVSPEEGGPVSQMQKIALQRVNADGSRHYLSAAGPIPAAPGVVSPSAPGVSSQGGTHPLIFQSPRIREEVKDGVRILSDEVDDYLCWTIVGICMFPARDWHGSGLMISRTAKFQYTFFDAFGQNNSIPEMPITPFPTVFTTPVYSPANHTLEITVSHFFYEDPKTHSHQPLAVYLGTIGPLRSRIYSGGAPGPLTNVAGYSGGIPSPSLEMSTGGDGGSGAGMLASRYAAQAPIHTMHTTVTVDMPSLAEVIKALQDDVVPGGALGADGVSPGSHGPGGGNDGSGGGQMDGGMSNGGQVATPRPTTTTTTTIAGRSLPLLFIRACDGVGYHSGRSITCENVFQSMDLGAIAPGHHVLSPPGGGGAGDPNWLAAAQAAANVEGGLHGWTLRVM